MNTIAVLTSGGDAPGMNAAIRAVVKVAAAAGIEVVGYERGYDGLMDGLRIPLTEKTGDVRPTPDIELIGRLGGTVLGSVRTPRCMTPEGRAKAAQQLASVDGLVVIGGNGSLTGAHALAGECGVPIVGIPASIDNDIGCTAMAIGVDTALNTIIEACDRISDTARAHRRAFIVEVMGRDCGYLAMAASVAASADAVLYREQGASTEDVIASVERVIRNGFSESRNKRRVLIIKAEGIEVPTRVLVAEVERRIAHDLPGVEVRATVLGHVVRGGSPSYRDRMIAGRLGFAAVNALREGISDVMTAWSSPLKDGTPTQDPYVSLFTLERMVDETRALLDGSSPITIRRVQMMEAIEGVLSL